MDRSQSFASAPTDFRPFKTRFRCGSVTEVLNLASEMQLVGSLCKRHVVTCAPTACRRTVSGTISLPYSGCFSPFPYGTGSLSIDKEYLALRDGTRRFRQDFSGPALLRILYVKHILHLRGYHPLWLLFPKYSILCVFLKTVLQPSRCTHLKFGLIPVRSPLLGESFVIFFSSGYLDVSVLRVSSLSSDMSSTCRVVPFGNLRIYRLCAAPRSLSQLTTSFFASYRLGIHHTPLIALNFLF